MIDELEATLPAWLYASLLAGVPPASCSPPHIHFLQRADDDSGAGEARSPEGVPRAVLGSRVQV